MVCFLSALKSLSHIERKEATLSTKYVIVVIFSQKGQIGIDIVCCSMWLKKKKKDKCRGFALFHLGVYSQYGSMIFLKI